MIIRKNILQTDTAVKVLLADHERDTVQVRSPPTQPTRNTQIGVTLHASPADVARRSRRFQL
jgi:hypothetical protein